jgi:alpha-glucosidase
LGINDYVKIAESAARHHLLVEFHGATKPTGLSRTYPNVLTYEAVLGSEHDKNYYQATPGHDVTIPFMRSLAGAFDYGPGAMDNANENSAGYKRVVKKVRQGDTIKIHLAKGGGWAARFVPGI